MVLAEFLKTHLLEPREQRLRKERRAEGYAIGFAEGYAQGRATARAEFAAKRAAYLERIRSGLLAMGLDPDEILGTDPYNDNARRC